MMMMIHFLVEISLLVINTKKWITYIYFQEFPILFMYVCVKYYVNKKMIYLDFPNQFPMTATTHGQPVDWKRPTKRVGQ